MAVQWGIAHERNEKGTPPGSWRSAAAGHVGCSESHPMVSTQDGDAQGEAIYSVTDQGYMTDRSDIFAMSNFFLLTSRFTKHNLRAVHCLRKHIMHKKSVFIH